MRDCDLDVRIVHYRDSDPHIERTVEAVARDITAAAPVGVEHIGRDELRFLAIGDWGDTSPTSGSRPVAAAMAKWARDNGGIDFVLALGDNFYPRGAWSEKDACWDRSWADVFLQYKELQVPWWVILGNVSAHIL